MTDQLDGKKLEQAYKIIAGIVRMHGDKYLPVFKRMHEEVTGYRASRDLLRIALEVSAEKKSADQ